MIKSVGALKNVFKIPDLRRKILYTLMMLVIYRVGSHVPTPFIDRSALTDWFEKQRGGVGGGLFQVVDLFSGKAFSQMSIFALGIMPYISVSIILQLMAVVLPRLQKLQQEGALGQRKINKYTRLGTIALTLFQSAGIGIYLMNNGVALFRNNPTLFMLTTMVAMTTGTAFIMWLGERISEKGIGNGISLIIAVGILAHYPSDAAQIFAQVRNGSLTSLWILIIIGLFIVSSVAIILIQEGTRRIPMQHAKRVVGRRVLSGGTNYLPLKINTAGVIPVIFASAILSFPGFLASWLSGGRQDGGLLGDLFRPASSHNLYTLLNRWGFDPGGAFLLLKSANLYILLFALCTGFFCYFYTAVAFNPDDVANNLKKSGSFIPGKRPGKPTSEYIDYVLTRITTVGAIFLVLIAIVPLMLEASFQMPVQAASFVGGTGLIIVIGVLLDTLKQIESQLLMRHYEGFAMRRASASRWR